MLGQLPYFGLECSVYTEKLKQYFEVNNVDAKKRKALLLSSSLDETVYKTLRDLCQPQQPKDKTYEELIQLLSNQYVVRTSIYRERVAFYTDKQERNETIAAWYARLKKLSMNCKFGEHCDNVWALRKCVVRQIHSWAAIICDFRSPVRRGTIADASQGRWNRHCQGGLGWSKFIQWRGRRSRSLWSNSIEWLCH